MTCCPPNSSSDRSSSLCNATSSDPIITAEQTTRSTLISPIPTTVHSRATLTMIYLVIHPILIHSRLHLLWLLALEHPPTPCLLAHGHEKVPKRRKGQGEMIYPKLKLITNLKVSKGIIGCPDDRDWTNRKGRERAPVRGLGCRRSLAFRSA